MNKNLYAIDMLKLFEIRELTIRFSLPATFLIES